MHTRLLEGNLNSYHRGPEFEYYRFTCFHTPCHCYFHKYSLVAISFTKKYGSLHSVLVFGSRQPYSRTHRSVYPMSDLAAMWDMDGTTNDDTTSTVLDGNIPDSRHRPAHMDSPDFHAKTPLRYTIPPAIQKTAPHDITNILTVWSQTIIMLKDVSMTSMRYVT